MAKLRKMLGDINSQECVALMNLIETQSKSTLAAWAIGYAKDNCLTVYEKICSDFRLRDIITACEEFLNGEKKLAEIKPLLKEAAQLARDENDPVAQAAARAVATACATVQTPTNSLGFLFYLNAAVAYDKIGLAQTAEAYDEVASSELGKALVSLMQAAVSDERNPVKIKWYC